MTKFYARYHGLPLKECQALICHVCVAAVTFLDKDVGCRDAER